MLNIKISVIIQVYNSEKTIIKEVTSVLKQTYKGTVEIIVINDSSTDNTLSIMGKFKSYNPDINLLIINQSHGGVQMDRNAGLKIANGDLIVLIESDDEWMQENLEKQVNVLEMNPILSFIGCLLNNAKLHYPIKVKDDLINVTFRKLMLKITPQASVAVFKKLIESKAEFRFESHFYGYITSNVKSFFDYQALINNSIFIHGLVSKNKVPKIIADANILINIGNNNPYQELSKIIEYIYLGKPIINIYSIENDSAIEILKDYSNSLNVYPYEIENETTIIKIIDFLKEEKITNSNFNKNLLSPYLLGEVENKYYYFLLKL